MKFLSRYLLAIVSLQLVLAVSAQTTYQKGDVVVIDGNQLEVFVSDEGDTLFLANILDDISVSSPREFASDEERKLYRKYRYYAPKVYPYAVRAIRIFRETEHVTATMSKRKRKKHVKRLAKELKKEFEEPLKGLTKTQGYILVKMIERETGEPMYDLIKELRGGIVATYWSTMGRMFGHRLKAGYEVGADPILDIVLADYTISYEPAKDSTTTAQE